jgi:hypothetical protein
VPLPVTVAAVGDGSEAEVVPAEALADDAGHLLEVAATITDRAGHPLEAAVSAAFTTLDATPPEPPIVEEVASPACSARCS